MPVAARLFIALGALAAALAVALGAAGAHALAGLPELSQSWFRTALQYQQFHALGLLAAGLLADRIPSRWITAAGVLMIVGTLLFSGNLYLRTLWGIDSFRSLVPWGGGAWMLAWITLAVGVARGRSPL